MKIDPGHMAAAADQASELLSLGNRHRLLILCRLTEGERSVGDLAAVLQLRNSTVSQHLSLLRRDGLVKARRDGQTIWYAIATPGAPRTGDAVRDLLQASLPVRAACASTGNHGIAPHTGQEAMTITELRDTLARTRGPCIDPNQCGPASPGIEFAPWQRGAARDHSLHPDTGAVADRRQARRMSTLTQTAGSRRQSR